MTYTCNPATQVFEYNWYCCRMGTRPYLIEPELRVWSLIRQEMAVAVLKAKVGE